jgi:NADH-quinone oxidoreductase subunit F
MTKTIVKVGMASCGVAAGARPVFDRLSTLLDGRDDVVLKQVGCVGLCFSEPLVEIEREGVRSLYGKVTPEFAEQIVQDHVDRGEVLAEGLIFSTSEAAPENTMVEKQVRVVLRNCGRIDPEKIDEYIAAGGYEALKKVLDSMPPEQVIQEILDSGLRGRGGAGFPTGLKWKFARAAQGSDKYVVCNADEGDPGAFMDRSVLESDPHSVLEGMAICAYAIGATHGIIYCRAEYPLAIKHLNIALKQARERGFLGERILGKDFSFDMYIKEGAGAFVCGEETALIASIEGKRGTPRPRPPFPAQSGVWGKPTNINNVETLANVAWIIQNGAGAFNRHGIGKSRGTKVFALAGKIAKGGLVEVPMGMPLREVIFDVGGGIPGGKAFKAVQMGGPSGGCIPATLLDTPVDYESINATGAIMGSGGMIVMDESTCVVDVAKFFLSFTQRESCGKCPFCRIGTKRMLEILERISKGEGKMEDLDLLEELCAQIKDGSLCGLGQTAPNPVLTTLKYFRAEYEAHILDRKCPAKACTSLIHYTINPATCIGCTKCARVCPVKAISGSVKQPHVIDDETCVRCGQCINVCPVKAITVE